MTDRVASAAPRLCLPGVLSCYMLDEGDPGRCIVERGPFAGWTDTFIYGMYLVPKSALDPAIWPEARIDPARPRLLGVARTLGWVAFSNEPHDLPYVQYTFRQQWFLGQTALMQLWTPDGTVLVRGRGTARIEDPEIDPTHQELSLQRLVRGLSDDQLSEGEARVASALSSFLDVPEAMAAWEQRLEETFAHAALHADQIREVAAAVDGAAATSGTISTSWATMTAVHFDEISISEQLHPDAEPAPAVVLPAETVFSAIGVAPWQPATPMPKPVPRLFVAVPQRMSTRDRVGWVALALFVAGLLWYLSYGHP